MSPRTEDNLGRVSALICGNRTQSLAYLNGRRKVLARSAGVRRPYHPDRTTVDLDLELEWPDDTLDE